VVKLVGDRVVLELELAELGELLLAIRTCEDAVAGRGQFGPAHTYRPPVPPAMTALREGIASALYAVQRDAGRALQRTPP
jgi:hypothetical protein